MIAVVIGNTRYSFYSSCYITGINCWMGVTAFFFFFFFFKFNVNWNGVLLYIVTTSYPNMSVSYL